MNKPLKASVIIPTYDDDRRLRLVLEGFCHQTTGDFEVIVVNDGGDISTRDLVESYSERLDITYLYLGPASPDFRVAKARNLGVQFSTGDLIIFVDCDCIPARNLVECHLSHFEPRTVLCGRRRNIPEEVFTSLQEPLNFAALQVKSVPWSQTVDEWRSYFVGCHNGIPAALYCEVGGFDEAITGWGGEDIDLLGRFTRMDITMLNLGEETMVYHLDHPPRATHQRETWPETVIALRYAPLVRNGGPLIRNIDRNINS